MYFATYFLDIATLVFLYWFLNSSTAVNIYRKRPFLIGIILTLTIIFAEAGTIFAGPGNYYLRNINIFCNLLGFALTPLIPVIIAFIFGGRLFRRYPLLLLPSCLNVVATVLSPVYGFIFYVDAANHYTRGDYYFLFVVVYIINFLLLVFHTLEVAKKYNYPITRKLVALSVFIIIGTSIQLVHPAAYSSLHCVTLSLLLFFLLISEFDSSFDPLTGLYNRASFDKATKQIAGKASFSVIAIDINDFKTVNDTYGHDYGDMVIKAVAGIIRKSFGDRFNCYRLGGDEFFVIGNETDQEKIEKQLKTMVTNLAGMREEGVPLPTVSYGYSIFREGEMLDFRETFKEADEQMYHFKRIHKATALREKKAKPFS